VSQLDVSSLEEMQTFTAFAAEKLGPIDLLVNNAEIMLSPLHELMIDVNIRGVLHGIAAGLPEMRARQLGQIVSVSSIGGHHVWPARAAYSGTKFTVLAISERPAPENHDVRVMVISPHVVESELAHTISGAAKRGKTSAKSRSRRCHAYAWNNPRTRAEGDHRRPPRIPKIRIISAARLIKAWRIRAKPIVGGISLRLAPPMKRRTYRKRDFPLDQIAGISNPAQLYS